MPSLDSRQERRRCMQQFRTEQCHKASASTARKAESAFANLMSLAVKCGLPVTSALHASRFEILEVRCLVLGPRQARRLLNGLCCNLAPLDEGSQIVHPLGAGGGTAAFFNSLAHLLHDGTTPLLLQREEVVVVVVVEQ